VEVGAEVGDDRLSRWAGPAHPGLIGPVKVPYLCDPESAGQPLHFQDQEGILPHVPLKIKI